MGLFKSRKPLRKSAKKCSQSRSITSRYVEILKNMNSLIEDIHLKKQNISLSTAIKFHKTLKNMKVEYLNSTDMLVLNKLLFNLETIIDVMETARVTEDMLEEIIESTQNISLQEKQNSDSDTTQCSNSDYQLNENIINLSDSNNLNTNTEARVNRQEKIILNIENSEQILISSNSNVHTTNISNSFNNTCAQKNIQLVQNCQGKKTNDNLNATNVKGCSTEKNNGTQRKLYKITNYVQPKLKTIDDNIQFIQTEDFTYQESESFLSPDLLHQKTYLLKDDNMSSTILVQRNTSVTNKIKKDKGKVLLDKNSKRKIPRNTKNNSSVNNLNETTDYIKKIKQVSTNDYQNEYETFLTTNICENEVQMTKVTNKSKITDDNFKNIQSKLLGKINEPTILPEIKSHYCVQNKNIKSAEGLKIKLSEPVKQNIVNTTDRLPGIKPIVENPTEKCDEAIITLNNVTENIFSEKENFLESNFQELVDNILNNDSVKEKDTENIVPVVVNSFKDRKVTEKPLNINSINENYKNSVLNTCSEHSALFSANLTSQRENIHQPSDKNTFIHKKLTENNKYDDSLFSESESCVQINKNQLPSVKTSDNLITLESFDENDHNIKPLLEKIKKFTTGFSKDIKILSEPIVKNISQKENLEVKQPYSVLTDSKYNKFLEDIQDDNFEPEQQDVVNAEVEDLREGVLEKFKKLDRIPLKYFNFVVDDVVSGKYYEEIYKNDFLEKLICKKTKNSHSTEISCIKKRTNSDIFIIEKLRKMKCKELKN